MKSLKANWISTRLLKWYAKQGRQHLPWKHPRTAYGVWISEIMLQQTQVATVIPYYQRFMQSFPNVERLAQASLDDVLQHWAGLGYYARARHLHKSAQQIVSKHQAQFPQDLDNLMALPGIGRSTAGAILAQAFQQRAPILDGNVKRVLSRFHCVDQTQSASEDLKRLWELADYYTPTKQVDDYTQAIMDIGATLCTRSKPQCHACPLQAQCQAFARNEQEKYPIKKVKKAVPLRDTVMLLIENRRGEFLLRQRPLEGIWGGLWSLPECQDLKQARAFIRQHFGIKATDFTEQPPLVHKFTHFQLTILPFWVILPSTAKWKLPDDFQWISRKSLKKWGIPTPVKKLFQRELIEGDDE